MHLLSSRSCEGKLYIFFIQNLRYEFLFCVINYFYVENFTFLHNLSIYIIWKKVLEILLTKVRKATVTNRRVFLLLRYDSDIVSILFKTVEDNNAVLWGFWNFIFVFECLLRLRLFQNTWKYYVHVHWCITLMESARFKFPRARLFPEAIPRKIDLLLITKLDFTNYSS